MQIKCSKFKRILDPSIRDFQRIYSKIFYINDHTLIHKDGQWHVIGITHEEPAAPLEEKSFLHAVGKKIRGQFSRLADNFYYSPKDKETHIWAPYIVEKDGTYFMYYCAGSCYGHDKYRIHLATSVDLFHWERSRYNPMVIDGYDARDPMVIQAGDKWLMYYTCTEFPQGGRHCVACVESNDLYHWGKRRFVFMDEREGTIAGPCESPYVLQYKDSYLLFIGLRNSYSDTHIYASKDPLNFKKENWVGNIKAHACEIVREGQKLYITHCGWGQGGLYVAELKIFD